MRRMQTKIYSAVLLVIILLGLSATSALAASQNTVVIGNSYTLESGQVLTDDLFILGGNVILQNGSTIDGNVILVGGSVQAAGTIHGNVVVLGGTLNLTSTAVLNGNLTTAGTAVNRDPGAQITGQINTNQGVPTYFIPGQVQIPNVNYTLNPFFRVVGFFLRIFLWALAAMVLAMFIPNHMARITQAAITQPLISGGLGLLTVVIVPIVMVLLAITICLIPVSLLGLLSLAIGWIYGLISLGFEVGKRISSTSATPWHPALSAGLGTLLLMAVLSGLEALIPCVGWIPKVLVGFVGLGAVLLTQFGMKPYTPTPGVPTSKPPEALPPA
jgi:hypothetical protein